METNFDYIKFANKLRKQVRDTIPEDLNNADTIKYIENKVQNSAIQTAERLKSEDNKIAVEDDKFEFACQAIVEWTFHKTIDLLRANISNEYHNDMLGKIFDAAYFVVLEHIVQNLTDDYTLFKLELVVRIAYQKVLDLYEKDCLITEQDKNNALKQDSMLLLRKKEVFEQYDENYYDLIEFTKNKFPQLAKQVPEDLTSLKNYISDKVLTYLYTFSTNFSYYYGADVEKEKCTFAYNQISSWIFLKTIALLRLDISDENIDFVLHQIAYTIYETFKQELDTDTMTLSEMVKDGLFRNFDTTKVAEKLQYKVNFVYKTKLEILKEYNIIDNEELNSALNVPMENVTGDKIEFNKNVSLLDYLNKNESRYLKDKIKKSYAENLTYRYLLKAGHLLKKNNYSWIDRHNILSALKTPFLSLIWKIDAFDEIELSIIQLERVITVVAEIVFQRIIILHKLGLIESEISESALRTLVRSTFNNDITDIKESNKYAFWSMTESFAHRDFKNFFKPYVKNETITKKQYNHLLDKSNLVYLKPVIFKFEQFKSVYDKNFWIWWTILYLILFSLYKYFYRT